MPRKPDAALENRILDAAYKLWSKRGEDALTMRAVAKAAGTTTISKVSGQTRSRGATTRASSRETCICLAADKLAGNDVRPFPGICVHASPGVPPAHIGLGCAAIASGTEADI
jgi:hypothetical protein